MYRPKFGDLGIPVDEITVLDMYKYLLERKAIVYTCNIQYINILLYYTVYFKMCF